MNGVQITINRGQRILSVNSGDTLLRTLAGENIFLPSACGGKAMCGLCKVQVLDGADPINEAEQRKLTPDQIGQGLRLACQIRIARDLAILLPEKLFAAQEYTAKVAQVEQLNHDTRRLRLELQGDARIRFKAGQYVQLYSEPYGQIPESVFRAYSIASPPSDSRFVDLIIRLVPQGVCTTYVHTVLQAGDTVRMTGPYGEFYLRGQANDLIFIAGGSGLAPMRSIIADNLEKQTAKRMTLFFGAVTRKDLYDVAYYEDLASRYPNFRFIPALSKPDPADAWTGETGLITEVVDRHIPDAGGREAYLCGSPGMINACLDVLHRKGFPDTAIFYDKY
jgi:Na+-transporting NADH:ubiquinone oxidoreductase subunit F